MPNPPNEVNVLGCKPYLKEIWISLQTITFRAFGLTMNTAGPIWSIKSGADLI